MTAAAGSDIAPATDQQPRIVVLVGKQIGRATGSALQAAEHRVMQINQPSNLPRMSLVFRLRARHTALLDPLVLARK